MSVSGFQAGYRKQKGKAGRTAAASQSVALCVPAGASAMNKYIGIEEGKKMWSRAKFLMRGPGGPSCQGLYAPGTKSSRGQTQGSVGLSGPSSSFPKQPLRCMARKVASQPPSSLSARPTRRWLSRSGGRRAAPKARLPITRGEV